MINLNNKGQTLIMFVILVPVLLILMAIVIDIGYLYRENAKLKSVTKTIIKDVYSKKDANNINNLIYDLYKKNNINTQNIKIENNVNYLKITNKYNIDSIFGKIIGIKKYELKVSLKGYNDGQKIQVKKE